MMSTTFDQVEFNFEAAPAPRRRPRVFLGWHRPLVELGSRWLWDLAVGQGQPVDLSDTLVIVPTRGATRLLRRGLLERAQEAGQGGLLPPEIRTPSFLLDLGVDARMVATPLHRLVAWVEVFQKVDTQQFPNLFPRAFASPGFGWAMQMARDLVGLQNTLGEGAFSISTVAVAEELEAVQTERLRWIELAQLETLYLDRIKAMGLTDPVEARILAQRRLRDEFPWKRLVVLGVADPPPAVDAVLSALSSVADLEVVVGAPEMLADDFDMWGRPLAENWTIAGRALPLAPDQIHLVSDQTAQACLVAERLRGTAGEVGAFAVGLADPSVTDPLLRELGRVGIDAFDPDGDCFLEAPMWGFLEAFGVLLRSAGSFGALQRLVRYPTAAALLPEGTELPAVLEELDDLESRRIPASVTSAIRALEGSLKAKELRNRERKEVTLGFLQAIRDQLGRFALGTIDEAAAALLDALGATRPAAPDADPDEAARRLRLDSDLAEALRDRASIVAAAISTKGRIEVADAYELVLSDLGMERSYTAARPDQVQLSGWLDLLWSDAAQVVVTGANEGSLPSSLVGDAFLPDSMRGRLGLRSNADRLARDRCLLELLLRSREGWGRVDLCLAKTDVSGDPLKPSRLLFACPDEALPTRVRALYGEPSKVASDASDEGNAPPWSAAWSLDLPYDPKLVETSTEKVSPTAFRDYLACPFVFYLRQILKMEPVSPGIREMDHRSFGNLCHEAFEALGLDGSVRDSTNAKEIGDFLITQAEQRARQLYGRALPVAVQVQMESVRERLRSAAILQAEEREDGWVIVAAELRLPGTKGGEIRDGIEDGEPFLIGGARLTGIIDRIERNEKTGAVRVIDYKTAGKAKPPRLAHLTTAGVKAADEWRLHDLIDSRGAPKAHRWIELQLPLYAAYLGQRDPFGWGIEPGDIQVGYFNLPLAVTQTAIELWDDFDAATVRSAVTCAEEVVRRMQSGIFWPPEAGLTDMVAGDFARLAPRGFDEDFGAGAMPVAAVNGGA